MMRKSPPPLAGLWAYAGLGVVLLWTTARWPVPQAMLHSLLVVALLPLMKDALATGVWALAAGWVMDLALRLQPHPGGTAWADLTMVLFLRAAVRLWPPPDRSGYVLRLLGGLLIHGLLVQSALSLANGPHAWGAAWLWGAASGLLWGGWTWKQYLAHRSL